MISRLILISVLSLLKVEALFEDQAGKFDWRQKYVGAVTDLGYFSTSRVSVLVVATESHVVAGLDADNGVIRWRHVFEKEDLGKVWDLHVTPHKHSVSVSGNENLFVRVWNSETGVLVVEHFVRANRLPDLVTVTDNKLLTVFYDGAEMELVTYSFDSKKISESDRFVLAAPEHVGAVGGAVCRAGEGLSLVCAGSKGLHSLLLSEAKSAGWKSHRLTGVKSQTLRLSGDVAEVELEGGEVVARLTVSSGTVSSVMTGPGVQLEAGCGLTLSQTCETEGRDEAGHGYCSSYSRTISFTTPEDKVSHKLSEARGRVVEAKAICEGSELVQVVLVMEDAALLSLTPRATRMFVREESLASLHMVQMVAMSSGDTREEFEIQKTSHLTSFFDPKLLIRGFLTRIKRHVSGLQGLILAVTDFRLTGEKHNAGDKFGLRKVVVGVTRHGKMFGFDSRKGDLLWQRKFSGEGKSLLIQRDGRSNSEEAQAMLVYKHSRSTYFLMSFNPITGESISEEPCLLELDQALLLPELHEGVARPVLLVGKDNSVQVVPQVALSHLNHLPAKLFVMTERSGVMTGNMVTVKENTVSLTPVWNMMSPGDRIISITSRRQDEVVHSTGRVLADR